MPAAKSLSNASLTLMRRFSSTHCSKSSSATAFLSCSLSCFIPASELSLFVPT